MKRIIELKHVKPKDHVRRLVEELIDRLEEHVGDIDGEAASVHVVFEENAAHRLFRASVTCHVPGRMVAAHEESHDAGATIRASFADVESQLKKHKARLQRERGRRVRVLPKEAVE